MLGFVNYIFKENQKRNRANWEKMYEKLSPEASKIHYER